MQRTLIQYALNDAALIPGGTEGKSKFVHAQEILEAVDKQLAKTAPKDSQDDKLYRWWIRKLRDPDFFSTNLLFRRNMLISLSKEIPMDKLTLEVYPYMGFYFQRKNFQVQFHECLDYLNAEYCQKLAAVILKPSREKNRSVMDACYTSDPRIDLLFEETLQFRVRRVAQDDPEGLYYNLDDIFQKCNQRMFRGKMPRPRVLYWSSSPNRTVMGHYNFTDDALMLNCALDSHAVPQYVLENIMFHELLHKNLGVKQSSSGRVMAHTPEFRRLEKLYPDYERTQEFLQKFTKTIK